MFIKRCVSLKAFDGRGLIQSMEEAKSMAQAARQVCLDAAAVIVICIL